MHLIVEGVSFRSDNCLFSQPRHCQAYRMSSISSGMDRENVKQITNVLHHVLLQRRRSQADSFFLLAHSVSFPTDSNGYPLFKNHYLNLFFSKTSSFFNSIRRFRSPKENPRAATLAQRLRLTSEDLYVRDMIRSERRWKSLVFGGIFCTLVIAFSYIETAMLRRTCVVL